MNCEYHFLSEMGEVCGLAIDPVVYKGSVSCGGKKEYCEYLDLLERERKKEIVEDDSILSIIEGSPISDD